RWTRIFKLGFCICPQNRNNKELFVLQRRRRDATSDNGLKIRALGLYRLVTTHNGNSIYMYNTGVFHAPRVETHPFTRSIKPMLKKLLQYASYTANHVNMRICK